MSKSRYTDAEKAAYYKSLALSRPTARKQYKRAYPTAKPRYSYKPAKVAIKERPRRVEAKKEPGIISEGGKFLGNLVHPIAGFLGGKIGHLVEQITGFGDYKVEQNSIMKGGMTPPQIVNSSNKGGFIIRHREYIGDVTATSAFTNKSYLLNPGLSSTFPWLSQIANSFETYRWRGVIFEFNSTSSDALLSSSTSTALGTVVMATEYDVADDPYTSKRDMLTSQFSSSSKPSLGFIHPIECKKSLSTQTMLFTRSGAVPTGYDQRLYDFCRFNIATEGMQAPGGVLGELWVVYEIELFKQQFNYSSLTDHYKLENCSTLRPLGTVVGSNIGSGGTIGGAIAGDALSYGFPQNYSNGKYQYILTITVGIGACVAPTVTYINASPLTLYVGNGDSYVTPLTSNNNVVIITGTFTITSQGAYILFATDGTIPVTVGDLWVTRLPDSITF